MGFLDDIGNFFTNRYNSVKKDTGSKTFSDLVGAAAIKSNPALGPLIRTSETAQAAKEFKRGGREAVFGVPAMMKYFAWDIPKDVYTGTGELAARSVGAPTSRFTYKTDDIAKGLANEYKYKFGPAFSGDFEETRKRTFAEDPFWTMFDIGALASGGSAIAGKAAARAVPRTTAGSRANKVATSIAGLEKVPDQSTPLTRLSRPYTSKDGTTYQARQIPIKDRAGTEFGSIPAARNPFIRGRQIARESLYSFIPAGDKGIKRLSPAHRGTKIRERPFQNIMDREYMQAENKLLPAYTAASETDLIAGYYAFQGIDSVAAAKEMYKIRDKQLSKAMSQDTPMTSQAFIEWKKEQGIEPLQYEGARRKTMGSARDEARIAREADKIADVVDLVEDMKRLQNHVIPALENPSPQLRESYRAAKAVDDVIQEEQIAYNIREIGMTAEDAAKAVEARRYLPLETLGIKTKPRNKPLILSHVVRTANENPQAIQMTAGLSSRRLKEQQKNEGIVWKKAAYDADPTVALDALRGLISTRAINDRVEAALMTAQNYSPARHQAGIDAGKLKHIKDSSDPLMQLVARTSKQMDRVRKADPDLSMFDASQAAQLHKMIAEMTEDAAKHGDGMVMDMASYKALIGQYDHAAKMFEAMGASLNTWRHLVLSYKGSYYANNFLGNSLLVSMAYGPMGLARSLREGLPSKARGELSKKVREAEPSLARTTSYKSMKQKKQAAKDRRENLLTRIVKAPHRTVDKFGEEFQKVGVKFTEENYRYGAFTTGLMADAKELVRANNTAVKAGVEGAKKIDVDDAAEMLLNDKYAVERMAQRTYDDLLDYSKTSDFEKKTLLKIYPFWNFTRAMTGRTMRLAMDEPWKVAVSGYIAGENIEAVEAGLDKIKAVIPDYLESSFFFDDDGKMRVIMTGSMNPFMAVYDTFRQINSLVTEAEVSGDLGANPLASANPYVKAIIETASGRDLFYDRELEGSPTEIFFKSIGKSIPQFAYIDKYRQSDDMKLDPDTGELVNKKMPAVSRTGKDYLLSYLGIPTGTLSDENIQNANEIKVTMAFKNTASKWGSKWNQAGSVEEREAISAEGAKELTKILIMGKDLGVDTDGMTSSKFDVGETKKDSEWSSDDWKADDWKGTVW